MCCLWSPLQLSWKILQGMSVSNHSQHAEREKWNTSPCFKVVRTIIKYPYSDAWTTHLWWFGGWFMALFWLLCKQLGHTPHPPTIEHGWRSTRTFRPLARWFFTCQILISWQYCLLPAFYMVHPCFCCLQIFGDKIPNILLKPYFVAHLHDNASTKSDTPATRRFW